MGAYGSGWVISLDSVSLPCPSCPPLLPVTDVSLELEQLREERNRLDAELQLSAHIIQKEVGRAREQGIFGPGVPELEQAPELGVLGTERGEELGSGAQRDPGSATSFQGRLNGSN